MRSHKYIENLIFANNNLTAKRITDFCSKIAIARYVGVVRSWAKITW
jgi:hypothetical protein